MWLFYPTRSIGVAFHPHELVRSPRLPRPAHFDSTEAMKNMYCEYNHRALEYKQ